MGCQPSTEKNNSEITQSEADPSQFKINYGQFVRKDIGDVFSFYHFSKILNRSSSSLVRRVIHRTSKLQRICKIITTSKKNIVHAIQQVQNLKNLDHPNIVQVQEYFFDKTYLYIIMETIQGTKLSQFLLNHTKCSLDSLIKIFQQLLSAVNYCHKKSIVHNLIHPENIMVIEKQKQYFLKLIDFSQASVIHSPKLTKIYFPKEYILFMDPSITNITNQKNDIWSCGILFLFIISGAKDFKDFLIHKKQIIQEQVACFNIEKHTENRLIDLLMKMLEEKPEDRLSAEDCLGHEIFKEFKESRPQSKHRKNEENFLSRLMRFKVQDSLQSVFWMYASLNLLSSTQKCEYMTEFCNLDSNKDGKLDKTEIRQGLINTFRLSEQQASTYVDKIFDSIDKNNNEYLQYSEFVMATSLISKHISEEELERIFREMDLNGDGYVTTEELGCSMGGMEGAVTVMKEKKKISLREFKLLMFDVFEKSQLSKQ